MTTNVKHIDSLAIVLDDFDIWGGRTALSESDFKIGIGGELPPSAIANLGNKKIISSDHLRGFNRLKTATRRFLLRYGMPFLNGVAVPVDKLDEVTKKLDEIGYEFESLKSIFLQNYDTAISDWVSAHTEYRDVILRNALSRQEVEKRLKFEYQVFMVQSSKDETQNSKLEKKVELLGDELLEEVASTASSLYDKHFAGRMRCGVRAKNLIKQLRDKIDGLSFLNGHLSPLVQMMDSALDLFDKTSTGYVEAPNFWYVSSVVLILSQRRTIAQFANGEINVQDTAYGLQGTTTEPLLVDSDTRGLQPGGNAKESIDSKVNTPTEDNNQVKENREVSKDPLSNEVASDIDKFFSNYSLGEQQNSVQPSIDEPQQTLASSDTSNDDLDLIEQPVPEIAQALDETFSFDDEPAFF